MSSGFEATIAIASAEGLALSQRPSGPPLAAAPGARVDRYLILDELGRGGMGVVYAAYDPQLDRKVAIKVISVDALSGHGEAKGEAQARLLREAQAMARLSHPSVVAVHDVGSTEHDVFIAMEMVAGQTLRAWLAEAPRSVAAILEVFIAAGRGLEAAHAAGLVHRDFKPDNVLLDRSGAVKIADFGLARRAGQGDGAPAGDEATPTLELSGEAGGAGALTRTGTILGTPAYMAPEQHLSLTADARSDQFSFCVALFEALHGYRPFGGATLAELREQVLRGVIEAPTSAEVPRWLLPILARGLASDPAARWPSIAALIDQLGRDPGRTRRRRLIGGALGLAIAASIAGGLHLREAQAAAALAECRAPEAEVAALYGPQRREAVRRALVATGTPHPERSLRILDAGIDDFIGRWTELHAASCDASLRRRTLAPELMALRERCADRQRREVSAVIDLLTEADATVVEHVSELAAQLPRPAACDDLRTLAEIDRGKTGGVADPRAEALRNRLFRVYAEANAGRFQEALERVTPLLAEAEALGERRVLGEIRSLAGRISADLGDLDGAEVLYLAGLGDALATDFPYLAAEIANQMMYLDGALRGRAAEGRRWSSLAEGLITRTEDDDLRLQYLNYLGALHSQSGAHAEGLAIYDEALALADRLRISSHDRASLLTNRGILLNALGRPAEAIAAQQEALALLRGLVGDDHPDVALTINGLGLVYLLIGDLEAASARFSEALAIQERLLGPEHPILALTLLNLGNAELEAGRGAAAKAHAARSLALLEAGFPAEHLYFGYVSTLIGDVALRGDGDAAAAVDPCARGLSILEANLGDAHPHLAYPLICLGEAALARGDAPAARPLLERALAVHGDGRDVAVADRGHVRFALARALAAVGEAARARALAEEALGHFAAAGRAFDGHQEAVRRWLAAPSPGP